MTCSPESMTSVPYGGGRNQFSSSAPATAPGSATHTPASSAPAGRGRLAGLRDGAAAPVMGLSVPPPDAVEGRAPRLSDPGRHAVLRPVLGVQRGGAGGQLPRHAG